MQSLPVAFGTTTASYICCATIDVTQLSVAAYLYLGLGEPIYALVLLGLTLPQVPTPIICFLVRLRVSGPSQGFLVRLTSLISSVYAVCGMHYVQGCAHCRVDPGMSLHPALTTSRL